MRRIVGLVVFAVLMTASASAFAQDETKTKFYDFDDMLIDGQLKSPDILKTKAREKARFKRLLSLKKSFLPKLRDTAEEQALQ